MEQRFSHLFYTYFCKYSYILINKAVSTSYPVLNCYKVYYKTHSCCLVSYLIREGGAGTNKTVILFPGWGLILNGVCLFV